ncbi:MAG: flagellar hook-basal body complex protein [Lachnospiraceae bacterium]|nr:flagellar hook-basal body complex protein [Lachnospiraceae bacterium]
MMRSMYSGVSGLKTHQTKMDVIGNNIANVNTVAYKSSSITFSELMYQTTQKASGANTLTGTGGTNARQIGLGVQSAAINTAISSQGATQTTGNPFDICINGKSFFVVSDGSSNFFTRAGAFNVDSVGNLVMASNGYNVMGWGVDPENPTKIKPATVEPLRIMSADNMTYPPEATTRGYVSGILDKNDSNVSTEAGKIISLSFYDNLGYPYTAKFSIHSTRNEGEYYVALDDILDTDAKSITEKYGAPLSSIVSIGSSFDAAVDLDKNLVSTASFNAGTVMVGTTPGTAATISYVDGNGANQTATINAPSEAGVSKASFPVPPATNLDDIKDLLMYGYGYSEAEYNTLKAVSIDILSGTLNIETKTVTGSKLSYSTADGSFKSIDGEKSITLDFANDLVVNGTTVDLKHFFDIDFDWSATNMFNNSGTSTIGATNGDTDGVGAGRKNGLMSGITIQQNGMIYASYDNGMTRLMGQIAVAEFTNAAGLEKAGENLYKASLNSGEFDGIGVDITGSGGYMTTGVLEMSNVDLSAEFTEMITTQRGFQANSRIITVSDTMLEELVNLKR